MHIQAHREHLSWHNRNPNPFQLVFFIPKQVRLCDYCLEAKINEEGLGDVSLPDNGHVWSLLGNRLVSGAAPWQGFAKEWGRWSHSTQLVFDSNLSIGNRRCPYSGPATGLHYLESAKSHLLLLVVFFLSGSSSLSYTLLEAIWMGFKAGNSVACCTVNMRGIFGILNCLHL